jgi:lipopolysaccharide export system permease protein
MISLVFILNILQEIEFLSNQQVSSIYPIYLSLMSSPSIIFEMFPFIFLISTQLFFVKLFENKELDIFKYSGLKNTNVLIILSTISFITAFLITILFYNFSSSLKNIYLELKSNYTNDGKYLAVITKNGLWIKDKVDNNILMINSSKIESNYLKNNFITEFDNDFNVIRNITSDKIDISKNEWIIYNAKIFKKNDYKNSEKIVLRTNFDQKRIQTLFSNLSSLNILELVELRENYKQSNYSVTEIDLHLLKLISYPLYLLLITIFSSLLMLNIKSIKSTTYKISLGLFFSVIIYYLNNFSQVLGSTEKIPLFFSVFIPLIIILQ